MSMRSQLKRTALHGAGLIALGVIARAHRRSLVDASVAQERLFRQWRDRLAGTALGRDIRLDRYATHKEFIRRFPPRDYTFYESYVQRIMAGESNVLYGDATEFLLMTSGTSGFNHKIIPCNTAHRILIEQCQRLGLATLIGQSRGLSLSSDRFAYGTRSGGERVNGVRKDYISGLFPHLLPRILRDYVLPTEAALSIRDWGAKVKRIAAETRGRDVRGIFGVPAHLLHVLRDVLHEWGAGCLRDVWPHLEMCVYSGTSVQSFRHSLNRLAGGELNYFGAYVSTESPLGFEMPGPAHDPARMAFIPELVLYSFTDLNDARGMALGLNELQDGGEYRVNFGTPNGILHCAIHDWIKVAKTKPFVQCELMGRIDAVLNAATEKTSESHLAHAVHSLQERFDVHVAHYFVHLSENRDGSPCYAWTFFAETALDATALARGIDEAIMEVAADYREARLDARTLAAPMVRVVPVEAMLAVMGARLNDPGQFKMRHAFGSAEALHAYCIEQGLDATQILNTLEPEATP